MTAADPRHWRKLEADLAARREVRLELAARWRVVGVPIVAAFPGLTLASEDLARGGEKLEAEIVAVRADGVAFVHTILERPNADVAPVWGWRELGAIPGSARAVLEREESRKGLEDA